MQFRNLPSSECLTNEIQTPIAEVLYAVIKSQPSETRTKILEIFNKRKDSLDYFMEWYDCVPIDKCMQYFHNHFVKVIKEDWDFLEKEKRNECKKFFLKTFKNNINYCGMNSVTISYFPVIVELIKKEFPFDFGEILIKKILKWAEKCGSLSSYSILSFIECLCNICFEEKNEKLRAFILANIEPLNFLFSTLIEDEERRPYYVSKWINTAVALMHFNESKFLFESNSFIKIINFTKNVQTQDFAGLVAIGTYLHESDLPEAVYKISIENLFFPLIAENYGSLSKNETFINAAIVYLESILIDCARRFEFDGIGDMIGIVFEITQESKKNSVYKKCLNIWEKISIWAKETAESPDKVMAEVYYPILPDVLCFVIDEIRLNDEKEIFNKESAIINNLAFLDFLEFDSILYEQITSLKTGYEKEQISSLTASLVALKDQREKLDTLVDDSLNVITALLTNKSLSVLNRSHAAGCFLSIFTNFNYLETDFVNYFVSLFQSPQKEVQELAINAFNEISQFSVPTSFVYKIAEKANYICICVSSNSLLQKFVKCVVVMLQNSKIEEKGFILYKCLGESIIQQLTKHFEEKEIESYEWINEMLSLLNGLVPLSINSFGKLIDYLAPLMDELIGLLNQLTESTQLLSRRDSDEYLLKELIIRLFVNYVAEFSGSLTGFLPLQLSAFVISDLSNPNNHNKSIHSVELANNLIRSPSFTQEKQKEELKAVVLRETCALINNGSTEFKKPFVNFVSAFVDNLSVIYTKEIVEPFMGTIITLYQDKENIAIVSQIVTSFIRATLENSPKPIENEFIGALIQNVFIDLIFGKYKFAYNELIVALSSCLHCINEENAGYIKEVLMKVLYMISEESASELSDSIMHSFHDIEEFKSVINGFLLSTTNYTEEDLKSDK